jgi:hypothetical protein
MTDDFLQCPALEFGKRAGFNDADAVTDLGLAGFIVDVVFLGALDNLVELGMGNTRDVFDDDGFVHLVRYDHTDACFAQVQPGFLGSLAHSGNGLGVGGGGRSGKLAITEEGEDFGSFAPHGADTGWIFQLAGGPLEAEVEGLLLEFTETGSELVSGAFAEVFDFGSGHGSNG